MSKPGISKHDISAFNESKAISYLSRSLESNHTIKTFFSENDKTPNHDGFFELIDDEHTPKKQFIVQIKKVENLTPNQQGKNKGKYVYSLKTSFLYYVKAKVTENPAIYFVVDISQNRIFWIYLSDELLMSLNFEGHETISFPFGDENILKDINSFTIKLNEITNKRNALFCYKSQEEIMALQDALDYINQLFDNDFRNIKESIFPNLWRFGIKASKTPVTIEVNGQMGVPAESSIVALYPQIKGKLDTGIQEYSLGISNYNNHMTYGGKTDPMKYAKESVHKALQVFFERGIPISYLPDIVLMERICPFVEKTDGFFHKEKTNKITIQELELRCKCLLMFIDKILAFDNLSEQEFQIKSILINKLRFSNHSINITSVLSNSNKELVKGFVEINKNKPFAIHSFLTKTLDKESIDILGIIEELKKRNIMEVAPVWNYEWFTLRQMDKNHFLSLIDEITMEWFANLPALYNETYENLLNNPEYKIQNKIVYKNNAMDYPIGLNRFSTLIHKYNNQPFSIQFDDKIERHFTEELKRDGLSTIIDGITLDSFIDRKLLYYESLNCLIYKGICEKLGFEAKELDIGERNLPMKLKLF